MKAIEFTTTIKDGVINIPKKYNNLADQSARIIVLTEEENHSTKQDVEAIEVLIKNIKERKVFQEIKDPVSWQRSIRDEWK